MTPQSYKTLGLHNSVIVRQKEDGTHLSVRRGVDDVINRGRRGENGHVSSFEMLDPVTELGPIQTRHHYGVDQLPWEERRGRTKPVIWSSRSLECAMVRLSFWG